MLACFLLSFLPIIEGFAKSSSSSSSSSTSYFISVQGNNDMGVVNRVVEFIFPRTYQRNEIVKDTQPDSLWSHVKCLFQSLCFFFISFADQSPIISGFQLLIQPYMGFPYLKELQPNIKVYPSSLPLQSKRGKTKSNRKP